MRSWRQWGRHDGQQRGGVALDEASELSWKSAKAGQAWTRSAQVPANFELWRAASIGRIAFKVVLGTATFLLDSAQSEMVPDRSSSSFRLMMAESDRHVAGFVRVRTGFDQVLGRLRLQLAGQISFGFSNLWRNVEQTWEPTSGCARPHLCSVRPNLGCCRPHLCRFGQISARCATVRPRLRQFRPKLLVCNHTWLNFAQVCMGSARRFATFARF